MANDEKERELVLQREVPFARELVWKAMTEPEHQNRWWGPFKWGPTPFVNRRVTQRQVFSA